MTPRQAAAELGIAHRTVLLRLESGMMQGQRLHARQWLIPLEEVERWKGKGKFKTGRKPKQEPPADS